MTFPVDIDNRGSLEVPFGNGYVRTPSAEYRLGYAVCPDHVHVFVTNWGSPPSVYFKRIISALSDRYGKPFTFKELRSCSQSKANV